MNLALGVRSHCVCMGVIYIELTKCYSKWPSKFVAFWHGFVVSGIVASLLGESVYRGTFSHCLN